LLGARVGGVAGFDFDIELHLGAGAYVCGEESALIESLEGKRGIPRNRPPYPVTHGYRHSPTVVNNVETLAAAALIARGGAGSCARRHAEVGRAPSSCRSRATSRAPASTSTPSASRCGRCSTTPAPSRTQAVQVGGPSGTLLAAASSGGGSRSRTCRAPGAFMVFDERRDMVAVVDNFARFFAHESCGFCTPCRVGTTLAAQMMTRMAAGAGLAPRPQGPGAVSRDEGSSHCGLGATAGNPVVDALEKFRPAFERPLRSLDVLPTFDLDEALAPAREATAATTPAHTSTRRAVTDAQGGRPSSSTATTCRSTPGQSILAAALGRRRTTSRTCATTPSSRPTAAARSARSRSTAAPTPAAPRRPTPATSSSRDRRADQELRLNLVQFLFTEGNHFCPSCEAERQLHAAGVAYELGMTTAHYSPLFPDRPVDASHPDVLLDFNRCILCELCVRASAIGRRQDVFALSGRGITKHLIVNAESGRLADTALALTDKAMTCARWA
jgi:hypothetical protein